MNRLLTASLPVASALLFATITPAVAGTAGADDALKSSLPDLEVTARAEFGNKQYAGLGMLLEFKVENKGKARGTDTSVSIELPQGVQLEPTLPLTTYMLAGPVWIDLVGTEPAQVVTDASGATTITFQLGQRSTFFTPTLEDINGVMDPGVTDLVRVYVTAPTPQLTVVKATASTDNGDSRLRNNNTAITLEFVPLP